MSSSLTFGKRAVGRIIIPGGATIVIDVRVSEDHTFGSRITDYPVQDGSVLSDHIIVNPFSVGLNGIVSNTPLPKDGEEVVDTGNGERRSDETYQALVTAVDQKKIVSFESTLATYKGAMTGLTFAKDKKTGEAISFNVTFREIKTGTVKRANPSTFPDSNELALSIAGRSEKSSSDGRSKMGLWEGAVDHVRNRDEGSKETAETYYLKNVKVTKRFGQK